MCKILAMSGMNEENQKKAWLFAVAAVKPMIKNDPHGFGYVALTENDEFFGERWSESKDAMKNRQHWDALDLSLLDNLKNAIFGEPKYNSFGKRSKENTEKTKTLIMHSRYATCEKGIKNAHPFLRSNVALVHNGMISNQAALNNISSTCDSECILNEYIDKRVDHSASNIQSVADRLNGSYACAVLNSIEGKRSFLDIFRNYGSNLVVAKIKDLNIDVFCTNAEILKKAAKSTHLTLGTIFEVKAGHLIRIDAHTGKRLEIKEFKPSYSWNTLTASAPTIEKPKEYIPAEKQALTEFSDEVDELMRRQFQDPIEESEEKIRKHLATDIMEYRSKFLK